MIFFICVTFDQYNNVVKTYKYFQIYKLTIKKSRSTRLISNMQYKSYDSLLQTHTIVVSR